MYCGNDVRGRGDFAAFCFELLPRFIHRDLIRACELLHLHVLKENEQTLLPVPDGYSGQGADIVMQHKSWALRRTICPAAGRLSSGFALKPNCGLRFNSPLRLLGSKGKSTASG